MDEDAAKEEITETKQYVSTTVLYPPDNVGKGVFKAATAKKRNLTKIVPILQRNK